MKYPITLILLGDIAAGKGTQAAILAKRYKPKLVETGAYTRKVLTGKIKVSARLEKTKLGKLAPSDIIQGYLKAQISKLKAGEGILIDGGKMPAEAHLIYRLLLQKHRAPLVIYLTISKKEIYRRLVYRYYCSRTGEPLIIKSSSKRCPKCGASIIKRADDDPQAIKNRIAYYDKVYSKTVRFWQSKRLLKKINGNKSIAAVTKDIIRTVENAFD